VSTQEVRRALGWALVLSLCVAALTAIGAVLSGDFDDTDWKVISTSLAFGVYTALGASGASLRSRGTPGLRTLGLATMALALIAFVLLPFALWIEDGDASWERWGSVSLAALAASHASLVLGAGRSSDGDGIRVLSGISVTLAAVDAAIGILAIAGAFDDIDGGGAQAVAVMVILLILTTALPPILRKLHGPAAQPAPAPLARELLAAADRIEALHGDAATIRECERLRGLARAELR
jgi:hypothetical protein